MKVVKVNRPHEQSLIQEVPLMSAQILEDILSKAHQLFLNTAKWLPAYRRIEILEKAAQIMTERIDKLTKIAAQEGGKPYQDSKVEVLRAING
ncbi:MAG: aldehyde dehydrogenase family protein, partial [Maribacter sp.]|nr:aldehyde dehydrogenase family protein [Maribacter sp.]